MNSEYEISVDSDIGASRLTWKNLTCEVQGRKLLNNISGSIQGKLMAIMGPSGAGKTTLLNTLALRNKSGNITGDITLNGHKMCKNIVKRYTGYVMQDDLFFENLTVRENLTFAAKLRLPVIMTSEEKERRVEEVITILGLRKCAETIVGGHEKRGISGGERKRLSVGVEMLCNPSLLFLDEPTSGLDSSTAWSIINVLKENTKNCTAICTIHQPSTKIFELFDYLMILAGGNIVYFGSAKDAVDYYNANNFPCPPLSNPADHFLDVISSDPSNPDQIVKAQKNAEDLIKYYQKENNMQDTENSESEDESFDLSLPKPDERAGFLRQFYHIYRRSATNYFRQHKFILTQLIQSISLAILIGLVFLDLPLDQSGITRRFSACFFIAINQGVFAVYAVITSFPLERSIILRERASGTYTTLPYFIAKSFAELPIQILFPSIFTLICYFMIGFQRDFYAYAHFWILVELGNMCAISLGFAISAASPTVGFATVFTPLLLEIWRLFGGFFSQPTALPGYLFWIQCLSFITYVFTGIARNEIYDLDFHCTKEQYIGRICPVTTGEEAVERFNLIDIEVYQCELVLIGMIIFYRTIAYFCVLKNKH